MLWPHTHVLTNLLVPCLNTPVARAKPVRLYLDQHFARSLLLPCCVPTHVAENWSTDMRSCTGAMA
jgi:hypothetical protein